MKDLAIRVQSLETSVARWRVIAIAVACSTLARLFIGAQPAAPAAQQTVVAREFRVVGDDGVCLATLKVSGGLPSLRLYSPKGKELLAAAVKGPAGREVPSVSLNGPAGTPTALFGATEQGGIVSLYSERGGSMFRAQSTLDSCAVRLGAPHGMAILDFGVTDDGATLRGVDGGGKSLPNLPWVEQ